MQTCGTKGDIYSLMTGCNESSDDVIFVQSEMYYTSVFLSHWIAELYNVYMLVS